MSESLHFSLLDRLRMNQRHTLIFVCLIFQFSAVHDTNVEQKSARGLYVCNFGGDSLINSTSKSIKVAYARHEHQLFISSGWFFVAKDSCQQLTSFFADRIYYLYAESVDSSEHRPPMQ